MPELLYWSLANFFRTQIHADKNLKIRVRSLRESASNSKIASVQFCI
jgi:hypothetical protein